MNNKKYGLMPYFCFGNNNYFFDFVVEAVFSLGFESEILFFLAVSFLLSLEESTFSSVDLF